MGYYDRTITDYGESISESSSLKLVITISDAETRITEKVTTTRLSLTCSKRYQLRTRFCRGLLTDRGLAYKYQARHTNELAATANDCASKGCCPKRGAWIGATLRA